jgi:transposase-like protein
MATSLQNSVWEDPPSDNAIRRWLKQFQETGSVLHRKGAAIETVTQQMLENTCREIEYRLDILRAMKGAHVEVV